MRNAIIGCVLLGCAHTSQSISNHEDARDATPLVELLRDPDPQVRARAALGLGRVAAPATLPQLRQALSDRDSPVRTAAAVGLGIAGDLEAERPLLTQLQQATTEPEREAIVFALGLVGRQTAAEVLARISDARSLAALGVIGYRKQEIPANSLTRVVAKLGDQDAKVRWAAAYALSRLPEVFRHAVEPLKAACADPDAEVRSVAVRALGVHGPDEVATLDKALGDADWHVRVHAARALAATAAGAVKLAARLDASMDLHMLLSALEALRGEAARPEVERAAVRFSAHADERVRCAAAVLADLPKGKIGATRGCGADEALVTRDTDELRTLWDSGDARVQAAVAEQVGRMVKERQGGSKLLKELIEKAKDPGALAAVAEAARTAGDSEWRDQDSAIQLSKRLSGTLPLEARISVVAALGALAEPSVKGALRKQLSHHNVTVRDTARKSLERLEIQAPAVVQVDRPPPSKGNVAEAQQKPLRATIQTDRGAIVVELYGQDAPRTVASFVHLARTGFYKGLRFHRVVPDFVIQGGDPRGDGFGGADYDLRCEYHSRPYGRGAVGMALAGKDTGSSQFFITHSPQPHLAGRYTLFGQVVEGMEVVDAIQRGDVIQNVVIGAGK
jgi:cyclophilin family peptidyl-prolyl cis-trans isomerase